MGHKKNGFEAALAGTPVKSKLARATVAPTDKHTPALMMDVILGALEQGDESLGAAASELLARVGKDAARCGEDPTKMLTARACDRGNSSSYRSRLLGVIDRIGISDPGVHIDIFALSGDPNPEVAEAAAGVIATLRRTGESMDMTQAVGPR